MSRHKDEVCYIVGKGPSLDKLTADDFGPGPIITINEAIVKIEQLDLPNKVYSLQQDGKTKCMRRPKRATLLLSERSDHWYKDYEPRETYHQLNDFGLDRIFSAITAMHFARRWECKKLVFVCFDACTCETSAYARSIGITYRDPHNSLRRFQRFCEIIKLMLGDMEAEWYPNKTIKTAPYTIITLTGDRHQAFRLCRKYILNQTLLPAQWIVVDDGKIPLTWNEYGGSTYVRREPRATDSAHTICHNMLEALRRVQYSKVLIFEDDDWYAPNYAETMLPHLDDHDLVGLGDIFYYHYGENLYACHENDDHSCLAATAFTKRIMHHVQAIAEQDKSPLIDRALWAMSLSKRIVLPRDTLYVGMKGLAGRQGQTSGHRPTKEYYEPAPDGWLKDIIGDDFGNYAAFKKPDIAIPKPKGVRVRHGHDGSIYIPRRNRQFEQYMDKHFERIGRELRWIPKVTDSLPLDSISQYFKGAICNIVGKGPSLDNLTLDDFEPGPIIAINEAIHRVEELRPENPIFMMQQDVKLGKDCWPKYGTVLVPMQIGHLYHAHNSLCTFSLAQLGIPSTPATVVVAIELAKLLESSELRFLCFDAYTDQKLEYAKCVGYPATDGGAPTRFLRQAAAIDRHVMNIKSTFIKPASLTKPFVCTPEQ